MYKPRPLYHRTYPAICTEDRRHIASFALAIAINLANDKL
jgi:hypothetical protein